MKFPIKYKLASIIFIVLIPMLTFSIINHLLLLNHLKKTITAENLDLARDIAKELDDVIDKSFGILTSLAVHPAVISHDTAECDRIFALLLPSFPMNMNILAANMDGDNYGSAVKSADVHRLNYKDREWFVRASKGDRVVGNLHMSKLFKRPSVMFAMPVFNQVKQVGVLGFPLDLDLVRESIRKSRRMPENAKIMIIDSQGTILVDTLKRDNTGMNLSPSGLTKRIFAGDGSMESPGDDGIERLYSFSSLSQGRWRVVVGVPVEGAFRLAQERGTRQFAALLIFSLGGLITALYLSRRITSNISKLTTGMQEIEDGNLDIRLHLPGHDELATVADSFNSMTERRKKAEEEIRRLNASLEERVKARTAELEATNRELESFSYSVSHDLRAPLRHISGFARILMEEYSLGLDAEGMEVLNRLVNATDRMDELIDAMLEISRLTRHPLNTKTVDLSTIAEDIATRLSNSDPERRVEFSIAKGLSTEADPLLAGIILENLLGNAWKYTSKKDKALIEFKPVESEAGEQVYCVRDNGAGFNMDYKDKLFVPFQRLHSQQEFNGTGIGLATVQRIINRHGGKIWAESEVGKGAAFYFAL